ncbi:hypothetical protein [Patulibacter sp. SYSU D01012]|uniref:hypothetical protein n=1 Tax=Patulibacter sp. SYSU D01012 TaxID=2817381 RepID=UPI001B30C895|nr:hypothetical protein [Patulibacter sp. SYSU D01012]
MSVPRRMLVRELCAWRGGLTAAEVAMPSVRVGDARRGPLRDGADASPLLADGLDAVLPLVMEGAEPRRTRSAALAWTRVVRATGGHVATLPAGLEPVRAAYAEAAAPYADEAEPAGDALATLEALGVLRTRADGVVPERPPAPDPATLLEGVARYEAVVAQDHVIGSFGRFVVDEAHRTFTFGVGQRRWRELAETGRLRVTLDGAADGATPPEQWDVGLRQFRPREEEVAGSARTLIDVRSGIPADALPPTAATGDPLLLLPFEIGSLMIGPTGYTRASVALALRCAVIWMLVAETTAGRAGPAPASVSQVAAEYGQLFGLTGTDHRKTVRAALEALCRSGILARLRTGDTAPAGAGAVWRVQRAYGASYGQLRSAMRALDRWRLEDPRTEYSVRAVQERAVVFRTSLVADQWADLLRRRAVRVTVLPPRT